MKRIFIFLTAAVLIFSLILTSCGKKKYSENELITQSGFSYITSDSKNIILFCRAETYLYIYKFNGTALIGKGDKIVFAKGYGCSDFEKGYKNTADTVYDIASITKQFTAAGVMRLCEEGKLSLYDTIDKYFPEYEQSKDLTVYDLLTMRSGLREYTDLAFGLLENPTKVARDLKKEFPEIYSILTGGIFNDSKIDRRAFLPYIFSEAKENKRGEFDYCNSNYLLLGMIIEEASGEKYEDFIKREFFDRLGMTNSNLNGYTTAKGYINGIYIKGLNPDLLWAAGGICSSVKDVFKWDRALFSGRAVSEESFKQMITPAEESNYGLGLLINGDTIYHEGQMLYFSGINAVDRKNDITVILLTNIPGDNHVSMYYEKLMEFAKDIYSD